jgi:uncharacterized protein YdbL (DUF1318 family)
MKKTLFTLAALAGTISLHAMDLPVAPAMDMSDDTDGETAFAALLLQNAGLGENAAPVTPEEQKAAVKYSQMATENRVALDASRTAAPLRPARRALGFGDMQAGALSFTLENVL